VDESKVKELLEKLDDPNVSPVVKQTIKDGLERAMSSGFKAAYDSQLRYRARTDLECFCEYVFGFKVPPHQKEIIKILEDPNKREVLIVAPPGSAKSSTTAQVFMPYYIGQHPEDNTILLSSSATQSIKFTSDIRSLVVSNERFKEVFPEIKVDDLKGESREQIYLKRQFQNPHPNIYAAGMKSTKVLGSRANLIVVDDPLTQVQARSEVELRNQKE